MTIEELRAERERILKALSQPQEIHHGDRGLTNRSIKDHLLALERIDAEIDVVSGTPSNSAIGRFVAGDGL